MTPKETSEIAQELWELQKQELGYTEEVRMVFIMGACYGMARMEELSHPFVVGDEA